MMSVRCWAAFVVDGGETVLELVIPWSANCISACRNQKPAWCVKKVGTSTVAFTEKSAPAGWFVIWQLSKIPIWGRGHQCRSPHEIHSLRVMTSDWSNSHRKRLHQVASCEAILPAGSITVTISNIFHSFSAFVTSNDHVRQAILHTSSKIRLWRVSTGCHMRCRHVISQETNQRWFPVYFSAVVITFPMFLRNRSTWPFASGQKGLIFR